MFYFVSKIVWFFLTPSNALVTLTLAGLWLMRKKRAVLGGRLAASGAVGLLVAGLSPLANAIIWPLEERFSAFDDSDYTYKVDGIIVLGGTLDSEVTLARDQLALNETGERIIALGTLARRYPQARVIYSGGGSEFTPGTIPEASLVEKTVWRVGIDTTRVTYERQSLNTFENAVFTKQVARPKPGEHWLLVTSAFHMPRAVGVFRKVGFDVVPYPVDYRTAGSVSMLRPFGFAGEGLRRTDIAAKEWIGLLSYYLSGKTDEVFPAP